DHTAGFRVVEQLTWELARGGPNRRIDVWLNRATLERRASDWAYFERRGYCRLNMVEPGQELRLGPLTARAFAYAPDQFLTGFLLGRPPPELAALGPDLGARFAADGLTVEV